MVTKIDSVNIPTSCGLCHGFKDAASSVKFSDIHCTQELSAVCSGCLNNQSNAALLLTASILRAVGPCKQLYISQVSSGTHNVAGNSASPTLLILCRSLPAQSSYVHFSHSVMFIAFVLSRMRPSISHLMYFIKNKLPSFTFFVFSFLLAVFILNVLSSSYVYLVYLICICCILCVFVVLCVYCCSYFRCRTAGYKSVSGRSCDRPPRHRLFLVSLCLQANAQMVPQFASRHYMPLM